MKAKIKESGYVIMEGDFRANKTILFEEFTKSEKKMSRQVYLTKIDAYVGLIKQMFEEFQQFIHGEHLLEEDDQYSLAPAYFPVKHYVIYYDLYEDNSMSINRARWNTGSHFRKFADDIRNFLVV